ncbi:MAG: hypothetical protein HOP23_15995 [Methylococcaceae bacterium]|nr:hypothetical protein [Methylococcaceae bacterium]
MLSNSIISFGTVLLLSACSFNNQPADAKPTDTMLPNRQETVGFFSRIHKAVRDSERGIYGLMYGIRDGTDSFIYDVQKDYYQDYQK